MVDTPTAGWEHLFDEPGDDPACRPGRVLRLGRAAGRPRAARAAGDRRGRGRARGQLRGQGPRGPHGHGRRPGPPALPPGGGGPAPDGGLRQGQQGRVRGLPADDPAGRGALHRRGVPRRRRAVAGLGHARRDRHAPAPRGPRAGRPADHRRGGQDQVPGQGGQRRRQARRPAGGAARRRAGLPAPAAGRAALGRRPGHRRQAPRPWGDQRRRGGQARRGDPGLHARPGIRPPPPRPRPQPRPPAGRQVGRRRRSIGSQRALGRSPRSPADLDAILVVAGRPGHPPDADRRPGRPDGGPAPALRRLHPGDPLPHPARGRPATPPPSWPPPAPCWPPPPR